MQASVARLTITGLTPYSQSRQHDEPKLEGETHEAYDVRTWRSKLSVATRNGVATVVIPAHGLHQSIAAAAKYSSLLTLSDISAKLVSVICGLIRILAVIYALIRTKRAYFTQKHTDTIANTLCREIMPEIDSLRAEIQRLNALITDMKQIDNKKLDKI